MKLIIDLEYNSDNDDFEHDEDSYRKELLKGKDEGLSLWCAYTGKLGVVRVVEVLEETMKC